MYKIPAQTLFVGKNLVFLPECQSTNTYLQELSSNQPLPEGTLVITDHQTAGRGQRANTWVSEAGKNLTLSILLYPKFLEPRRQFLLSQAVSLGIHDALRLHVEGNLRIKWPNDVMLNNRKLTGILIENQLAGHHFEKAVVGIGLNVNQNNFFIPTATSLAKETGNDFDRQRILDDVCKSIEVRYMQLKREQLDGVNNDYHQALYWKDEPHTFLAKEQKFAGTIRGVDDAGRLLVEANGTITSYDLKEIVYTPEQQ